MYIIWNISTIFWQRNALFSFSRSMTSSPAQQDVDVHNRRDNRPQKNLNGCHKTDCGTLSSRTTYMYLLTVFNCQSIFSMWRRRHRMPVYYVRDNYIFATLCTTAKKKLIEFVEWCRWYLDLLSTLLAE